jgi:hypothetical protein
VIGDWGQRMGMEVDQRGGLSPSLDYFHRKRLEEFRPGMQFSPQRSWFPITTFTFDWNQPHYRLGTPANHDFFPATGSFNQAPVGFSPYEWGWFPCS